MRYGSSAAHHALILRMVLSSHGLSSAFAAMIFSIVSAQWRL